MDTFSATGLLQENFIPPGRALASDFSKNCIDSVEILRQKRGGGSRNVVSRDLTRLTGLRGSVFFVFSSALAFWAPTTSDSVVSQIGLSTHHSTEPLHATEPFSFANLLNLTGSSPSGQVFLHNILSAGMLSDRLSAPTFIVQRAPLHNIRASEALKELAEKGCVGASPDKRRVKDRRRG